MRELSVLFTGILEVPVAMVGAELGLYRGYRTTNPKRGFEMLGYYIASLEELRKRLEYLRDNIVERVERDAEDAIATMVEVKKIFQEHPTITEEERETLVGRVSKDIPKVGESEEIGVDSIRRIYSVALLQVEGILAAAKTLKASYPPIPLG